MQKFALTKSLILALSFSAHISYVAPAQAERTFRICELDPLEGYWKNTHQHPQKHDVIGLEIFGVCQGAQTNLKLRVELQCGRVPCRWKAAEIRTSKNGQLYAAPRTFLAQRLIVIEKIGSGLKAEITSKYFSADRPDERQEWQFLKAEE